MVSRIFDILLTDPDTPENSGSVLYAKEEGQWVPTDLQTYRERSFLLASKWKSLGLQRGDRVATILKNSPDWNILDMSLLLSGLIHVPMYSTLSGADYAFILNEAQASVLVLEDQGLLDRFRDLTDQLPKLRYIVCKCPSEGCLSWDSLFRDGSAHIPEVAADIEPDDIATIIYTSGTTGHPKGVVLTHRNLVSNFLAILPISGLSARDKALSVLPLCHVYERMLNYAYQCLGMDIYYAESFSSIPGNLKDVSPSIFCAVPRILEKMYNKLLEAGRKRAGLTRGIYLMAIRFALKHDPSRRKGVVRKFRHYFFDRLIYSKWRHALGGNLRIIVSGGAALQSRLAGLFWAAGIRVTEGYGLTETSPVITVNRPRPEDCRIGTVGPALPGVEIKLADDGEILCKGPNLMKGYYLNDELTREVIDRDGWFHTGDIGKWVDGRFLKITDRKKEMFKTSGGRYIAPQAIEVLFASSSFIEQVMVVGENRRFPGAIIIPDFDYLLSWCEVKGHTWTGRTEALEDKFITERISKEITRLNEKLSQTERIKRYILVDDEWTTENGALTPTLKLRRAFLRERYIRDILEMYREGSGNE